MAESTQQIEQIEQIEQHIDAERRALGRNLQELEDKAAALTDWRTHYSRHPFIILGAAFGTALAVGFFSAARSRGETRAFEIDNIALAGSQVSAVPELSTWMMMIVGFAGLGGLAYRRSRRKVAAISA